MKTNTLLLLGLLIISSFVACKKDEGNTVEKQEYYYWSDQKKIFLSEKESTYVIVIDENDKENINRSLQEKGITMAHKADDFYIIVAPNTSTNTEIRHRQGIFKTLNIGPTFQQNDDIIVPTDQIIVKLKEEGHLKDVIAILGTDLIAHSTTSYGAILFKIKQIKNVFALSNKIYEKGIVEYAHPNLYVPIHLY